MDIARSLNLPVIIHDRDAHEDTLKILKEFKGVRGVLHCFSGSVEFAKEILKLDYYLGFTGVITFKNAKKAIDVLNYLPLDRILAELTALTCRQFHTVENGVILRFCSIL